MKFEDLKPLKPFRQARPLKSMDTCVIIPVKNEAEHLTITLRSLLNQIDENNAGIPFKSYEILLLINNSNDGSHLIAKAFKLAHPELRLHIAVIDLPEELANIGTVRKLLMDEAYRRFQLSGKDYGIIASIDSDTVADPQWIYHIRKEINGGNDAVGGFISTKDKAGTAQKAYSKDMTYRCLLTEAEQLLCPQTNDPLPRHFQFFGANMAVTAEYYRISGGIPLVECLEDMAFHTALIRCDARIRRSLNVKVTTSARLEGRVAIGFSEQLKKWCNESGEHIAQMVENSENSINLYALKGRLKAIWNVKDITQDAQQIKNLAHELELPPRWVKKQVSTHTFFGACWEDVWEASPVRHHILHEFEPIDDAIKKLKKFIHNPDVTAFQASLTGNYQHDDEINA